MNSLTSTAIPKFSPFHDWDSKGVDSRSSQSSSCGSIASSSKRPQLNLSSSIARNKLLKRPLLSPDGVNDPGVKLSDKKPKKKGGPRKKKKSDDKPETLTAYQAFFRHNFEELKAEAVAKNGGAKTKSNGIVSIIGQRWRELDGAAKASWEGSTIPQRQSLQRPKPRSLTAYQLFFRETAVELAPLKAVGSLTQNEIVRTIGERWRSIEPHTYLDLQVRAAAEATRLAAEGEEEMRARVAAHTLAHVADAESTCSAALGRLAAEAAEEERVHVAAQALAHGAEDVESTCSAALRRLAAEAAGEESALVAAQALAHIAADAEFTCSAALGIQKNAGLSAVPPGFAAI